MRYLSVKNFKRFQHYTDRTPPWIKLYNDLLSDYEFTRLQDASKSHLILIWLLASRTDNRIPADAEWIERMIHATESVDIGRLVSAGFLTISDDDSVPLADCKRNGVPEGEGEGEETRTTTANQSTATAVPAWMSDLTQAESDVVRAFLANRPATTSAAKLLAMLEGWRAGLGMDGGKAATWPQIVAGLADYAASNQTDYSPRHIRSFVAREMRQPIAGNGNGKGARKSAGQQAYDNARKALEE